MIDKERRLDKEIETPRDKEIETPRDKEIETPRDKEIETPRDKEIETPRLGVSTKLFRKLSLLGNKGFSRNFFLSQNRLIERSK